MDKAQEGSPPMGRRAVFAYIAVILFLAVSAVVLSYLTHNTPPLKRCMNIVFSQEKYGCIDNLAISTSNSSLCGYLPSGTSSNNCYRAIAQNTMNASLCERIGNSTIESGCITDMALATNSPALCGSEQYNQSSVCLSGVAYKLMNYSICTGIVNASERTICESKIYTKLALGNGDWSYCMNVSNATNTVVSGAIISNASTGSLELEKIILNLSRYKLISGNDTYSARDYCIIGSAYVSGSSAACSYLKNETLAVMCNGEAKIGSGTLANNATLNYTQMLSNCSNTGTYAQLCAQTVLLLEAMKTKNASMCAQLNRSMSYTCYASLAKKEVNASMCALISNSTMAQACEIGVNSNITNAG